MPSLCPVLRTQAEKQLDAITGDGMPPEEEVLSTFTLCVSDMKASSASEEKHSGESFLFTTILVR